MSVKLKEVVDQFGKKVAFAEGLEGVVATTSSICFIDGEKGKLLYRGVPIEQLAKYSTFEETSYFLLYDKFPSRDALREFSQRLIANRPLPDQLMAIMRSLPSDSVPMSTLRTLISALGLYDAQAEDNSLEENYQRAEHIIAAFPTIVAALQRLRKGLDPIAPNPNLSHAANFLYMLNGREPDEFAARVLDVALILHAEHGFNASTFTARVAISTLTDMYSAITSAVSSLKGPLHGGANESVMRLLREIGSEDHVKAVIERKLAKKEKIMGFGHRVYKALDPRAKILMQYSQKLAELTGHLKWYNISKKIEAEMEKHVGHRGIYPNVDFFSASVYHYLGIEEKLFTPIFAMSRSAGWTAHVIEQLANNRLFRPRSVYTGPFSRAFIPIEERE